MVYPGEKEREEPVPEYMATGTDRSKTLHNFRFPQLKWGNQRVLRCMKMDSPAAEGRGDQRLRRRSSSSESGGYSSATIATGHGYLEQQRRRVPSTVAASWRSSGEVEEEIDEVREKLMMDLTKVVDRMKKSILRQEEISVDEDEFDEGDRRENDTKKDERPEKKKAKVVEELPSPTVETAAAEEVLPWNLRTRKGAAASKVPPTGESGNGGFDGFNNRMMRIEEKKANHSLARNDGVRPKFSVALRKKEIEEDFMEMTGRRPHRRPKKRPRHVQKELDTLFPGLWLTEVTSDLYKVPESAETGKR